MPDWLSTLWQGRRRVRGTLIRHHKQLTTHIPLTPVAMMGNWQIGHIVGSVRWRAKLTYSAWLAATVSNSTAKRSSLSNDNVPVPHDLEVWR